MTLHRDNNITTGKIYQSVIDRERRGDYLGKTVQGLKRFILFWHFFVQYWTWKFSRTPYHRCYTRMGRTCCSNICRWKFKWTRHLYHWSKRAFKRIESIIDRKLFVFLQLGGTIGDIESMPFVEAFRQLQFRMKKENFCVVHVSLVPQVRFSNASLSPSLTRSIVFSQIILSL